MRWCRLDSKTSSLQSACSPPCHLNLDAESSPGIPESVEHLQKNGREFIRVHGRRILVSLEAGMPSFGAAQKMELEDSQIGWCQAPRADGLTTLLGGPYPSAPELGPPCDLAWLFLFSPHSRKTASAPGIHPTTQAATPPALPSHVDGDIAFMTTLKRQRSTRTPSSRIGSGTSAPPVKVEAKTHDPAAANMESEKVDVCPRGPLVR